MWLAFAVEIMGGMVIFWCAMLIGVLIHMVAI